MDKQTQYFSIANLIFTTPYDKTITLNSKEIDAIQNRFIEIVNSFVNPETTQYATNFIKNGGSNLPYSSMSLIGEINNHLILHFAFSYHDPILFIIDTKDNKVKNYIDIENAKNILDDEIFQDIKESLQYPKNLNNLFKGIVDINKFVESYKIILTTHNNPQSITGRDCFEINLAEIPDMIKKLKEMTKIASTQLTTTQKDNPNLTKGQNTEI